jgi:hypothetical protein
MYHGKHSNTSVASLYRGMGRNISMEEIYRIDYNSSIYRFSIQNRYSGRLDPTNIKVDLFNFIGLDGMALNVSGLLGLSLLTSSLELCGTFFFRSDSGVNKYQLSFLIYSEEDSMASIKAFMALPNQARSFDRFQLFDEIELPDMKKTSIDYSISSLKILQKRNTASEPCIDVDNYDKV